MQPLGLGRWCGVVYGRDRDVPAHVLTVGKDAMCYRGCGVGGCAIGDVADLLVLRLLRLQTEAY